MRNAEYFKFCDTQRFEKAFPEIPPVLPFSKGGVLLRNPQWKIPLFPPLEKGSCEKIAYESSPR